MRQGFITSQEAAERMCAGADSPEQMGTTGLCAWVYLGQWERKPTGPYRKMASQFYARYRRARSIIRKRLGDGAAKRFADACKTLSTNRAYGQQIDHFEAAAAK